MKVIVADKISDRGVQLLKEQPGWNVVMTANDSLKAEIADADALIVRSATRVTAELLDCAKQLRAVGRAGDEHARRKFGQRCRAYFCIVIGACSSAPKI